MVKTLFAVALLALGLGFAVVSDSRAQLVAPPKDAAAVRSSSLPCEHPLRERPRGPLPL
jgi:hypothetical protein